MKKITLMLLVLIAGISQVKADDTYTVAGAIYYDSDPGEAVAIFGGAWDPAITANDMTLKEGTTYTLTKDISSLNLPSGTYQFKICKDHGWTDNWGLNGEKNGANNSYVYVPVGSEEITFVFDSSTGENYAYTSPIFYTVAGGSTEVLGTFWDVSNTANDLTLVRDNTYILTKKNVTVTNDVGDMEFKVVKNRDYAQGEWPLSNQKVKLTAGTYDVTFIFNLDNNITYAFTSEKGINLKGNFSESDEKMTQDESDVLKYSYTRADFVPTDAIKESDVWKVRYKLQANGENYYQNPSGDAYNTYNLQEAQKFDLFFTADLGKNTVSLEAKRVVEIGASGMATIASSHSLDFAKAEDADGNKTLKAYKVTSISKTVATLTEVSNVKYGNGLLLVGTPNTKYTVPFGDGTDDMSDNKLQGAPNGYNVTTEGDIYILHTDGKFHPAAVGAVPAGKAYLLKADVPAEARTLELVFEGEATGISNVDVNANDNFNANAPMYNLAGQRVTKSYKGVVIQNGKKMLNK